MSGKINFPSHAKGWKKSETNNKSIPQFFVHLQKVKGKTSIHFKTQFTASIFGSPLNDHKWQVIPLPWSEKLIRVITTNYTNHNFYYYYMNCLYLFRTESKVKVHENISKDHDYSHMIIPEI